MEKDMENGRYMIRIGIMTTLKREKGTIMVEKKKDYGITIIKKRIL